MSKARNLADLLDANGDVASGALDNVPPSNDASALTTGTLPIARIADGDVTAAKLHTNAVTDKLGYTPVDKAGDTMTGQLNVRNLYGSYYNCGNLYSSPNPIGTPYSGHSKLSFTTLSDNNWRPLITNFNERNGMMWATVSDASSGDVAHYAFRPASPAYGVGFFEQVWYKNGGWNTGSFEFRITNVSGAYQLQVRFSSYYSPSNTATGHVQFLLF
jgi:hypothetical protein